MARSPDTDRERARWRAALPATLAALTESWSLTDIGAPFEPGGTAAWVAPARDHAGRDVVLKLGFRHDEARDEAGGLREWDGAGAVRVLADADLSDAGTSALLLERCHPGQSLAALGGEVQDRVIAGLLPRLWRTPPFTTAFRPLSEMCDAWVAGWEHRNLPATGSAGLSDAGLVRAGLELFRELPRSNHPPVLLCTDLHAANVLSADREPWLMIDPKPYVGDRTYDVLQHMLNRSERLSRNPHGFIDTMAGHLDLDAERLSLWLFARCVVGLDAWPELGEIATRIAPR